MRLKSKQYAGDELKFGSEFLVVALCLLACWPIATLLAKLLKAFPSLSPSISSSGKYQFDVIIPLILSVTVPLVVTTCKVAMDHPSALITSPFHQP